jgi:hypothetical protein
MSSAVFSLLVSSCVLAAPPAPEPAAAGAQLDAVIAAKWKDLTLAAPADDATFLRRVWLDLGGRVPPPLRAKEFLDDRDPAKRIKLVDSLLGGEEFADHWARAWTIRLTEMRPTKQEVHDGRVLHEYLRNALLANRSYRQVVQELITGEGAHDASGPANFLLRYRAKPADLAGAVGKQFMGATLQCAQCHDHMFARWKKDDFWGVAAFFGRLKVMSAEDGSLNAILEARRGELQVPDPNGKPDENGNPAMKKVAPRMPMANGAAVKGPRRPALAAWLTADDNPYFARNAVNQVWAQLMGAPLVKTLDDVDAAVQSRNGDILELLTRDFVAGGYDLKRLVRVIVLSKVYQLSAGDRSPTEVEGTAAADLRHRQRESFARFPMRPLSVDQLYYSIVQATGHKGEEEAMADNQNTADALESDDSPDRPVEFLGEHRLTLQRALVLLNSAYIHEAVQAGAKMAVSLNGRRVGAAHVDWLFLATLSRRPTEQEAAAMLELVRSDKGQRGLEDVLWVLLNSAEFNSNH